MQGPRALERLELPEAPAFTFAEGEIAGITCMVNRTGYTGEPGVELLVMADEAGALWDAVLERGVVPCGLGARDSLRLEVCYPLHGNDIAPDTDAISAGLGWVCALDKEFTGVEELRRVKEAGPERRLAAFVMEEQRDPAPGDGDRRGRRGHLGHALADARPGHRDGLRAGPAGRAGHRAYDRRARTAPPGAASSRSRSTDERRRDVAAESYPEDLKYHPEHDWARIEGDAATLGITWYGQDALGELVHYEPPDDGATLSKDGAYGEVESVKAVSDLISPLSGEVLEVNQKVVDAPETVNEDPYGDGWLVRIRVADPAEADGLLDAAGRTRQASLAEQPVSYLSLTDADREEMLAAIGVSSIDELFQEIPAGVRFQGRLDLEPALSELELTAHLEELAARNVHTGAELSFLGAGDLRPLRPRGRRRGAPARRVPDRVHAVPAGDEPGRAPDDLRVPDGDLRADRDGRLERVRVRRDDGRRRRLLHRQARDRADEGRPLRGAEPAGAAGRQDLRARLRARGRRGAAPRRDDRPGRARGGGRRTRRA